MITKLKTVLLVITLCMGANLAYAQQKESKVYKNLSITELEQRFLPQYKGMTQRPIKPAGMESVLRQRANDPKQPAVLANADSLDITDRNIPGLYATDPQIPVRIYKPKNGLNLPVVLWFHGGGFVGGNLNTDHRRCANMALGANCIVINVDYRLAPENPFPAALNDSYAALKWAFDHVGELSGQQAKIAVAGESAGGTLAGGLALMARDKKGPAIVFQLLIMPAADNNMMHPSVQQFYHVPGIKGEDLPVLFKLYTGKEFDQEVSEYALPGLAKDLQGLPKTYIALCGADPLRDGGLAYATRLIAEGIMVELHSFPGEPHGFLPLRFHTEVNQVLRLAFQ